MFILDPKESRTDACPIQVTFTLFYWFIKSYFFNILT